MDMKGVRNKLIHLHQDRSKANALDLFLYLTGGVEPRALRKSASAEVNPYGGDRLKHSFSFTPKKLGFVPSFFGGMMFALSDK